MLRAREELDGFRPHRMAVAERRPAVDTVLHFGPIADVRERTEPTRELHERLRFPPKAAPSLLHCTDSESTARAVPVSLPHSPPWCQFCRHWFFVAACRAARTLPSAP